MGNLVIEVRDRSLIVVEGAKSRNRLRILSCFKIELDSPLIADDELAIGAEQVESIKTALQDHHIRYRSAEIVLNNRLIFSRVLKVPKIKGNKQALVIHNEMINTFKLSSGYVIDYQILARIPGDPPELLRVLTSAISERYILGIEKLFKLIGIKIDGITSAISSIANLVEKTDLDQGRNIILTELSNHYIRFFRFKDGILRMFRSSYMSDDSEMVKRFIHSINNLSRDSRHKYGEDIQKVIIAGSEDDIGFLLKKIKDNHDVCEAIDLRSGKIVIEAADSASCFNSLGVQL